MRTKRTKYTKRTAVALLVARSEKQRVRYIRGCLVYIANAATPPSKLYEEGKLGYSFWNLASPPCDAGTRTSRASSILYGHHVKWLYEGDKIVFG